MMSEKLDYGLLKEIIEQQKHNRAAILACRDLPTEFLEGGYVDRAIRLLKDLELMEYDYDGHKNWTCAKCWSNKHKEDCELGNILKALNDARKVEDE